MNNLGKYRVYRRITQQNLAEKLHISIFKLRKIEGGENPNTKLAKKICDYFNVSHNQMFNEMN